MTATAVATTAQQPSGLTLLADAVEQARAAVRAANDACDSAQPEYDEVTAKLRDLRRERKTAPDDGATAAQLRALDSRLAETERRLEVSGAGMRRLVEAREAAEKAEREAERHLATAHRRAKELPRAVRDVTVYLVRRGAELRDAERVTAAIRASITEYQAMVGRLRTEHQQLTGSDLEIKVE